MSKNLKKNYANSCYWSYIQFLLNKTTYENSFGCNRQDGVPVNTDTDLEFTKKSLRMVNVQKNPKKLFLIIIKSVNSH